MLYIFLEKNAIKVLLLKKSLLGQYEIDYFGKFYQSDLLNQGRIENVDFTASALKEAINNLSQNNTKEKQVCLILPQETFQYLRINVPKDIATSALGSFILDKARSSLNIPIDECVYDYLVTTSDQEKLVNFFAIDHEILEKFKDSLALIDLKLTSVVPEALAYFKLFEKTLRKDKKENIFYVDYENSRLTGYLFDSFGLLQEQKWLAKTTEKNNIEEVLKARVSEFEKTGNKLNRLILSGEGSEKVRQDTFTKSVGAWTNPLKRIIPNFYQDYLKLFVTSANKSLPFLAFDSCFGAFIFTQENSQFSFLKTGWKPASRKTSFALPQIGLPLKEILLFLAAFILSFLVFIFGSKMNFKFNLKSILPKKTASQITSAIPTNAPTPTPEILVKKEDLKIKVLNGSGTVGKASAVKDTLKSKGYQDILTGNADNFDYTQSVLEVKDSATGAATLLEGDLKDSVASFKVTTLTATDAADVVLIVGQDFK